MKVFHLDGDEISEIKKIFILFLKIREQGVLPFKKIKVSSNEEIHLNQVLLQTACFDLHSPREKTFNLKIVSLPFTIKSLYDTSKAA